MGTILVVEDLAPLRRMTVEALQGAGYQVLEAAEGREALLLAKSCPGPIHLILTDVVMPHMTGRELADWLKRSRPEIRVLYMTGYAPEVISSRGLLGPGEWYIAKPFSLDSLLAKVHEILGPTGVESAS
jgi:hypothetical protein